MSSDGIVFDIQPFSTHDGPGIRTTVFLKGCNNRCAWCHNPESLTVAPQLRFFEIKCIGCGRCVKACPNGVFDTGAFDFSSCVSCGKCAEVCPTAAREMCGKRMTPEQVLERVMKDEPFYKQSGGGVTFSGGEPLLQADFVAECARLCLEKGIRCGIQTAGNVPYEAFEKVLPYLDFVMCDYKLFDPEQHKAYTGVRNERIVENIHRLGGEKIRLTVRTLVVGGVTDKPEIIDAISRDLKELPNLEKYVLLRYHSFGMGKLATLNTDPGVTEFTAPDDETMRLLYDVAKRNLPNVEY